MSNEPKDLLPPRNPMRPNAIDPVTASHKRYTLDSLNDGPELKSLLHQADSDAAEAAEICREHNETFAAELEGRAPGPTREKVAP